MLFNETVTDAQYHQLLKRNDRIVEAHQLIQFIPAPCLLTFWRRNFFFILAQPVYKM